MKLFLFSLLNILSIPSYSYAQVRTCSEVLSYSQNPSHFEVGQRIRKLMSQGRTLKLVRVKQSELADLLSVSQGYISKVLNGDKSLKLEKAEKISAFLGLTVETLFKESVTSPDFMTVKGNLLKLIIRSGMQIPEGRNVKYTQSEISFLIGVTQGNFTKILSGQRRLTDDARKILAQHFGIEESWLKGHGPIVRLTEPTGRRRPAPPRRSGVELARKFNEAWKLEVGVRIRKAMREKNRVIQREVAAELGVTQGYISKVVNGQQAMSLLNGIALADYLKVDASYLLGLDLIHTNSYILENINNNERFHFPDLLDIFKHFQRL